MVRNAASRSAFMGLFASFGGMVRVSVRPDCHKTVTRVSPFGKACQ